jgi:hypothetical protein
MKKCITCKQEMDLCKFGKNIRYKDGLRSECKECRNSKLRTGKPNLGRFQKGCNSLRKGVKLSNELIEKMRVVRRNPNSISQGTGNYRYRCWREGVLNKCKYKCLHCGVNDNLHCHHIKPWKTHIELRFDVDNGIALCSSCHGKEEVKFRKIPGLETRFKKGHKLPEESIKKMKETKRNKSLKDS